MEFWPDNLFLVPKHLWPIWKQTDKKTPDTNGIVAAAPAAVLFYAAAKTVQADEIESSVVDGDPMRFYRTLVLHGGPANASNAADAGPVAIPHELTQGGYNDFRLTLEAPGTGWLLLHQSYDPLWRVTIDGQPVAVTRANQFRMAVPVTPGNHTVAMNYRPFARDWYWPSCWLLETSLLTLGAVAWRAQRRSQTVGVRHSLEMWRKPLAA
jgi:hypothetical protein